MANKSYSHSCIFSLIIKEHQKNENAKYDFCLLVTPCSIGFGSTWKILFDGADASLMGGRKNFPPFYHLFSRNKLESPPHHHLEFSHTFNRYLFLLNGQVVLFRVLISPAVAH
jgi:hypothetical protein